MQLKDAIKSSSTSPLVQMYDKEALLQKVNASREYPHKQALTVLESTRCLLRGKQKTSAILFKYNMQTARLRSCILH